MCVLCGGRVGGGGVVLQGLFWGSVSILFPPTPLLPHSIVNWKLVTWWNINGKKKKKKKIALFLALWATATCKAAF